MKSCVMLLLFWTLTLSPAASASDPNSKYWIGTWAASPEAQRNTTDMVGKVDITYREIVHVSVGGPSVRVVLTNELGLEPLTIGAGAIALSTGGSAIEPSSIRSLRFDGQTSVTLPAGTIMVS